MSPPLLLSYAALWLLVIFQGLLLLGLVRTVYRLQRSVALGSMSVDGQALRGKTAPEFTATDVFGTSIESQSFAGKLRALLFVSPDCSSCTLTLREMEALEWKAEGSVIVICRASRDECRRLAEMYELRVPVLIDEDLALSELFAISSVPTAVLVGEDNRVQSYGQPVRREELEEMFQPQEEPALQGAR